MPCTGCLSPSDRLVYAGTWHDGTHIIPTIDADDIGSSPTATANQSAPSATGGQGKSNDDEETQGDDDDKKGDDEESKGAQGGGRGRRWDSWDTERFRRKDDAVNNPFFTPKLDSDDPGFVDRPVTVQFNFTGTSWIQCFLSHTPPR